MVYLINGKWNVKMQTSNNICQFVSMAGCFALPFVLFIAQSRDKHHIFYIQCLHAEKPLPNNTSVNIVSKALSEIRFSIEMAILNINIHDSQFFQLFLWGTFMELWRSIHSIIYFWPQTFTRYIIYTHTNIYIWDRVISFIKLMIKCDGHIIVFLFDTSYNWSRSSVHGWFNNSIP